MKKIRVVFGINDLRVGGAERVTTQIIQRLDPAKFECIVVTLFRSEGENFLNDLPPEVVVHQLAFTGFAGMASWMKLCNLLQDIRPDVLISSLFFSNTVFRALKPFVGYQAIACEHNTYVNKTWMQQRIDRILARYSDRIIAVSQTVADFTAQQEHIPKEKFVVIPNGIDVEAWQKKFAVLPSKETLRQELGFDPTHFIVLAVARLVPQKNQRLLLEAFAEFHKNHPQSTLAIVGDGPLRETLEQHAHSLGIPEFVKFFGVRQDLERFYKASDVFALTSDIEGFALVCIEAMLAGLPVVSTNTAGPDEYIKDGVNGYLVQERSAASVAKGLGRVVEEGSEYFRTGALQTAQRYGINATVKRYEELLEGEIIS